MQTPTIKKSISLPDEMFRKAIKKAANEHRTFSSYVAALIAKDVRKAGTTTH